MTEETTTNAAEVALGFTGNFTLRMDAAQRIAIPAKFREVLDKVYGVSSGQVVLIPDNGKVKVLPLPVWHQMERELNQLPVLDTNADEYRTFLYGNMALCQLDTQHRVRLTPSLCALADLQKSVVVVGKRDQMEIWDEAKWNDFNANTAKNYKAMMAEVMRHRLTGA